MKVLIVGQGNVATNLDAAFHAKNINCQMVSSREGLDTIRQDADVYIYAIRDEALQEVINKVHAPARAMHLHTSGTMPISVFGEDKPHCGIFYPLQTFSKNYILPDFSHVPLFIEAKNIDDVAAIYTLGLSISNYVYEASQQDRERLHVAGVMVNNFPNLLYGLAQDMLKGTHIPFQALLPLIDETAHKVHTLSPQDAQTGPARRGDRAVIQKHEDLITNPRVKEMYHLLSELIIDRS